MTNPAIEAVRNILRRYDDPMLEFEERDRVAALVAAVLDNLPRAEMIAAMVRALGYDDDSEDIEAEQRSALDAATSAARATLLSEPRIRSDHAEPDGTR